MNSRFSADDILRLVESGESIAKVRQFTLGLAFRGRLSSQDVNDEPAHELLRRVENAKRDFDGNSNSKRRRTFPPITLGEIPFEVPKTWAWSRVGNITYNHGQRRPKREFTYIDVSSIEEARGAITSDCSIIDPRHAPSRARKLVKRGCVIYSTVRPYLKNIAIIDKDYDPGPIVSTAFAVLHPHDGLDVEYLHCWLRSEDFNSYISGVMSGIAYPAVTEAKVQLGLMPVAPVAEQGRIMRTVKRLMRLCDQLEVNQNRKFTIQDKSNKAALHSLVQSGNAKELAESWGRIKDNFNILYNHPDTVDELKQAILQLAVRGKLAPQDPIDEPASELLERIAAEKEKLIKEGKCKKPKPLPSIKPEEIPYEQPKAWEWVRFGDVTINRDGERIPVSREVRKTRCGQYDYYGASGVIDSIDDFLFDKPLLLIGEDGANLLNRATPIAFIAEGQYWVNNHAHVIDGISHDFLRYLELFINATDLKPYVTGTAQPKMNQAKMNSILVGVPPESEQNRIVSRVRQLLDTCSELESKLKELDTSSGRLLSAHLHLLLAA